MNVASGIAGTVEWWYPVAVWAVVLAALARSLQIAIGWMPLPLSRPRWLPLAIGAAAFVPVAGLPLGRWLHGFNAGFSIPCVALLLDFVTEPLLRRPLFTRDERRTGAWFGLACGLALYPAALGLGGFDPYELGWRSPGVAAAAAVAGALLALRNNAFGIVLLVAGGLWQAGCLESDNAWDYLIDPVYWLLSTANLIGGRLTALWGVARGRATSRAAALLAVVFMAATPKDEPKTAERIDRDWSASAAAIERRAREAGHEQLAAFMHGWELPAEAGRQLVLAIPERIEKPAWIDTADEEAIWNDFCAARRARAEGLFGLAVEAARTHTRVPNRTDRAGADALAPLQQRNCESIRLLYRALRDDPDHERARAAGGWVRRDGRWVWPEAARRLDKGEEFSAEFGWLPKGRLARYRAGERYDRGRWVKADRDGAAAQPPSLAQGMKVSSDHWQITSTAGTEAAASLAVKLEETHAVWRQVFGGFAFEPAELERLFEGRGKTATHEPFLATLLHDRQQYVAELEKLEPSIARTLGIYWTPTRTAWFFVPPPDEEADHPLSTVHHEATHQLFAEMRKTSPLAGERCGFWAIEATACYMESLRRTEFGWTLGGRDAGRAPAARERLVDDGFYVPLEELCGLGRRELQADDRLPQIYSQISGLADFFMNGEQGRHREAFVEYLARIYTGTADPDTLPKLCGSSFADLDDAYRRHMAR